MAQDYKFLELENNYLYNSLQRYIAGLPPLSPPAILNNNYEQKEDPCKHE